MTQGFVNRIPIPVTVANGGTGVTTKTGTGSTVGEDQPNLEQPTIAGVTDGSSAAAGDVGEIISNEVLAGSAISATSTLPLNITSISLSAGEWDVEGTVSSMVGSGTMTTAFWSSINSVSATLPALSLVTARSGENNKSDSANNVIMTASGKCIVSITGTTNYYLVGRADFSVSTLSVYGYIIARRIR